MNEFFIYNDKFYRSGDPVISAGNRSLRYGDGIFETMKVVNGNIINKQFHFERLFNSLSILKFDIPFLFNTEFLEGKIRDLIKKNNHKDIIRVRLMVFRGDGGIFDVENMRPNYIIESWQLSSKTALNENGLMIDIFPDAKKSIDIFSNLKSNNYLPFVMAALYAKEKQLNECIVLNCRNNVCESIIGNIFIINKNEIATPPLSDGCVAGVMRRWMLEKFSLEKYPVIEKSLTINDLLHADELFITNAIHYLRWIKTFREKNYVNTITHQLYHHLVQTIE